MELRQFRYYVSIVDSGSLSRAAKHLYVAQSALSKQIAELEAELGIKLLVRSRTGVVMTEPGKVFYEYAQGITRQIGDAQAAVHLAPDAATGPVVVTLPPCASATLALPLLRAAAQRLPGVALHLDESPAGHMADQLRRGRVDIALFIDAMPREEIAFTPLLAEDFVCLHAPGDPLAPLPGEVSLEQAVARPLVLPARAHGQCTRAVIDAVLEAGGHPAPPIAAELDSLQVLKCAVEAGIGPTILPLALALREVHDGRLVARRFAGHAMARTLGVCVPLHRPATNAQRATARLIADVAGELCDSGEWPGTRRIS